MIDKLNKSGHLAESSSTSCGVQQPSISCSNNYDDVLEQEAEFYQSRISSENEMFHIAYANRVHLGQ